MKEGKMKRIGSIIKACVTIAVDTTVSIILAMIIATVGLPVTMGGLVSCLSIGYNSNIIDLVFILGPSALFFVAVWIMVFIVCVRAVHNKITSLV